jgi:threonine dehydratase
MVEIDRNQRLNALDFRKGVEDALARIQSDIVRTPLESSAVLAQEFSGQVFIKWECAQVSGSFKIRGALNKIRSLTREQKKRGVVSASTGNHGLALSRAAKLENVDLELFLPENAASEKVLRLELEGTRLRFFGLSCERTEIHARREAEASGRIFISPYNDLDIIFGQGTLGLEIAEDLPEVDDVLVPVGGGGLIAGIAGFMKSRSRPTRVIGIEPAASSFMQASLRAGRLVEIKERRTLADAVAGGIEPGSITFPLCARFVDEVLSVDEALLRRSMRALYELHGRIVEGAGALPLAGLRKYPSRFRNRRIVLLASGGNVSPALFRKMTGGKNVRTGGRAGAPRS